MVMTSSPTWSAAEQGAVGVGAAPLREDDQQEERQRDDGEVDEDDHWRPSGSLTLRGSGGGAGPVADASGPSPPDPGSGTRATPRGRRCRQRPSTRRRAVLRAMASCFVKSPAMTARPRNDRNRESLGWMVGAATTTPW